MTARDRFYGHLATVFREALMDTRRVEDALRILDAYRVRALALEAGDSSEAVRRVLEMLDVEIRRLLNAPPRSHEK